MVYAFDAVRRRPGRAVLTSLGIGLAIGLVVMLLALWIFGKAKGGLPE